MSELHRHPRDFPCEEWTKVRRLFEVWMGALLADGTMHDPATKEAARAYRAAREEAIAVCPLGGAANVTSERS